MKCICFVAGLGLAFAGAAEINITIGTTPLTIPVPAGFVPVTATMTNANRAFDSVVVPQNQRLASLVPEEFAAALERGELPEMPRTLSVQTARATLARTVTKADVVELKTVIVEQNAELVKRIEKELPGLTEQINRKLADSSDAKVDLSVNGMVPLPAHEQTERTLAYSSLVKYAVRSPEGATNTFSAVVTATFVHARAKLFFLYVNGAANDLAWTRQVSHAWAEAILAANPSDAATAAAEVAGPTGFDWKRVGRGALIGAVVGGLFGLFGYFAARRKPA
jgi:hypothetical protein